MNQKSSFLKTALAAVKKAEVVIKKYYSTKIKVTLKADQSPETIADREAEEIIRSEIKKSFPDHSILGEELGNEKNQSDYLWIIDPIDGTKNYLRGIPIFATEIALMKDDKVILGVSNAPALNELIYAEKNCGAYCNDKKITVSKITSLREAYLSYGSLNLFDSKGLVAPLIKLDYATRGHRGYGDFFGYHLLVQGKIDIMIEADTKIWDIAALSCILEEAGGKITDISGKPVSLDIASNIATNGCLHEKVLAYFNQNA